MGSNNCVMELTLTLYYSSMYSLSNKYNSLWHNYRLKLLDLLVCDTNFNMVLEHGMLSLKLYTLISLSFNYIIYSIDLIQSLDVIVKGNIE